VAESRPGTRYVIASDASSVGAMVVL